MVKVKLVSKSSGPGPSPGRGRPKKKKEQKRPARYRAKYTQDELQEAIREVTQKRMSLREAARHFGVPKATLFDRIQEGAGDKQGRPTVLSKDEEDIIAERLLIHGLWGFPLTRRDLCALIKSYLDGLGRTTRTWLIYW
jgi:transposase-like protein